MHLLYMYIYACMIYYFLGALVALDEIVDQAVIHSEYTLNPLRIELLQALYGSARAQLSCNLKQAIESSDIPCKGEFVVVVGGLSRAEVDASQIGHLVNALKDQVSTSVLADAISSSFGLRKKAVYNQILDAKHQDSP